MLSKRFLLMIALSALLFAALPALAQDEAAEAEAEAEKPTSAIKKIAISFSGGSYSGATYFDLPKLDDQAELEEGSHTVTLFDGTVMQMDDGQALNRLDAPRKEIESGQAFDARIGFYLNDSFHVDLVGSLAIADARISVLQIENGLELGRVSGSEDEGYVDSGFKSMSGGVQLGYEAVHQKVLGLTPGFGMGFGGVINRFTTLEDKTALYFQLYGELSRKILGDVHARFRILSSTYSFKTEEVNYGEQVTMTTATLGLTWMFDANPIYGYDHEAGR